MRLFPAQRSTREPQGVSNRLKHRRAIVDSKNEVPVQHRWSIHGCTLFWQWIALSQMSSIKTGIDFGKATSGSRKDSILVALPWGLCQPEFLSAARKDGLAKRPPGMAVLRARRERNSRAFIV